MMAASAIVMNLLGWNEIHYARDGDYEVDGIAGVAGEQLRCFFWSNRPNILASAGIAAPKESETARAKVDSWKNFMLPVLK